MANGTNLCFLPYHVRILAPGERASEARAPVERWSAVWVGREYQALHSAAIPLQRKPQDRVLRSCAFKPLVRSALQEPVGEREDGTVSTVWLYDDTCNPRFDADVWADYAERLGKLMRHLEAHTELCLAADYDPCQPIPFGGVDV